MVLLKRLRNENEDKTKTQMTQSFNQYSEDGTKIWRQNILKCVLSSFSFVISLLFLVDTNFKHVHHLTYKYKKAAY